MSKNAVIFLLDFGLLFGDISDMANTLARQSYGMITIWIYNLIFILIIDMIRIISIWLLVLLAYSGLVQTIISIDTIDVVDTLFVNTQGVARGQAREVKLSDSSV